MDDALSNELGNFSKAARFKILAILIVVFSVLAWITISTHSSWLFLILDLAIAALVARKAIATMMFLEMWKERRRLIRLSKSKHVTAEERAKLEQMSIDIVQIYEYRISNLFNK